MVWQLIGCIRRQYTMIDIIRRWGFSISSPQTLYIYGSSKSKYLIFPSTAYIMIVSVFLPQNMSNPSSLASKPSFGIFIWNMLFYPRMFTYNRQTELFGAGLLSLLRTIENEPPRQEFISKPVHLTDVGNSNFLLDYSICKVHIPLNHCLRRRKQNFHSQRSKAMVLCLLKVCQTFF